LNIIPDSALLHRRFHVIFNVRARSRRIGNSDALTQVCLIEANAIGDQNETPDLVIDGGQVERHSFHRVVCE
jgi:hypothetical protein